MYVLNQVIDVVVNSVKSYGVFVIADNGYTGLIHISQINGKYINEIDRLFNRGDKIKAKIIGVDEKKKHLSLSTIGINDKSLVETYLGFDLFEDILQEWIDEKIEEINKK